MNRQRVMKITQVAPDPSLTGGPVIYIMSRDQRVRDNHALLAAQEYALRQQVPLIVLFCARSVSGRSYEQYVFMYEGLKQVAASLSTFSIPLIVRRGGTNAIISAVVEELAPSALFFDFSPLGGAKRLHRWVSTKYKQIPCFLVDTHNIIPVWRVSNKREFAAHTIRRKITHQLHDWLQEPSDLKPHPFAPEQVIISEDLALYEQWIKDIPRSGARIMQLPGENAAQEMLSQFLSNKIAHYANDKNDPSRDAVSGLSPYLHFGMISSLRIALAVAKMLDQPPLLLRESRLADSQKDTAQDVFLEELIVRKELADNFCYYSEHYRSIESAWPWAQATLKKHATDRREYQYSFEQFRTAATHDPIWNAAQSELCITGKMHGYMRMYWAKKILEWSASPQEALSIAIALNDFYSIDGGDPNGYVGILWSIAGVHDRPWFDRPVYGLIRYMAASGLKRKFDTDRYMRHVESLRKSVTSLS
jgi:deoxyribodipyrimidine photo-lyase